MVGQCARCGGPAGDDGATFLRTEIAPGQRYGTYEAVVTTVVTDIELCGNCLASAWGGFARMLLEHPDAQAAEAEYASDEEAELDQCTIWCARPRPGWWQRRLVRAKEGRGAYRCPACWQPAAISYMEPVPRRRWWQKRAS